MSTTRTAFIGGQEITYSAAVVETVVSDGSGNAGATYVCTEYLRTDIVDPHRPVIFIFNGGPGSASVWTHLGIGPRRIADADTLTPAMTPPFRLVDNADSPLDTADLVFIDPPGTGYSRLHSEDMKPAFFGIEQDARATLEFIAHWTRRHRRENSPRFLIGESYGTVRAARMAKLANGGPFLGGQTRATSISGVAILGPALGIGLGDWSGLVSTALDIASLAASARYHAGVTTTYEEATLFGRDRLLPTLAAGKSAPDRDAVARELADLLGVDMSAVLAADLKVTAADYLRLARSKTGESIGAYDSRYVLPASDAGADPVADDPGMGQYMPAFLSLIAPYLRDELGYNAGDNEYIAIAFRDINATWDYGSGAGVLPYGLHANLDSFGELAQALRRDPNFRVMLGVGEYDLVTTRAATDFALARHCFDTERVQVNVYPSGHMPYLGAEARRLLAVDLRALAISRSPIVTG